jgi:transcriptional regulator with PAS, ATPase and Fis domain
VFLDEIGELDEAVQVKLLRVLQDRSFSRVGETGTVRRVFGGKILAATNRDLAAAMREGPFRPDFYFRLCADVITTPTLRDQLADRPDDLSDIVRYVIRRRVLRPEVAGSESLADEEVDSLVDEVVGWIGRHLGAGYPWAGNFRELEQCVHNLMIRRDYRPPGPAERLGGGDAVEAFLQEIREACVTSDEIRSKYYALVVLRTGSYQAASKRLGVDWRTVKKYADHVWLSELTGRDSDAPRLPVTRQSFPGGEGRKRQRR